MSKEDSDKTSFRIGLAYACYMWIGLFFLILVSLELYSSISASFTLAQGIGMVVLLPMGLISIGAGFLGLALSLSLKKEWRNERGLFVLLVSVLLLISLFVYNEYYGRNAATTFTLEGLLSIAALFYSIRWFLFGRKKNL